MCSDVTWLWLRVFPRLEPGVFIQIHDVFLPDDYPSKWVFRRYSEQYLLAVALLYGDFFDVVLPNFYASDLAEEVCASVGQRAEGGSLWMQVRG